MNLSDDWALNDEAIKNLGYMQMKKTHDAAMVIIERALRCAPRFNYYIGTSQGGREALTVAQRYPADYDGVAANVPIVSFSTLMLAPELIRIHEKPSANWVTPAKINAIRGEFMRQRDSLDGLADGIINNYMACRAIFDVSQGARNRHPWSAKRCANNVDPNPGETSADACLTDGQITTLEFMLAVPVRHASRERHAVVRNVGAEYRSIGERAYSRRTVQRAGRCSGGRREALASRDPWCDRLSHEEPVGGPVGLYGRRRLQSAASGTIGVLDATNGSVGVPQTRGQDARNDRHQRHVGVAGCAAGLLSVGSRQDGTGDCRSICSFVGNAANRSWAERQQLQRGWRR